MQVVSLQLPMTAIPDHPSNPWLHPFQMFGAVLRDIKEFSMPLTGLSCFGVCLLSLFGCLSSVSALGKINPMDTRGPGFCADISMRINKDGVQAKGRGVDFHPSPVRRWVADWVTAQGNPPVVLLRKTFHLEQQPRKAIAWITADKYLLYVNGRLASRGPADQGWDWTGVTTEKWFYDCRDISPLLRKGVNCIAILEFGNEGCLFQADIIPPHGKDILLKSDPTWKAIPAVFLNWVDWTPPAGTNSRPSQCLQFDGKKEPVNWQEPSFDDSRWSQCILASGVKYPLILSELPPCMEARYPVLRVENPKGGVKIPLHPFQDGQSVVMTSDGSFDVRFDRILSAYYGIEVIGGANAHIALQSCELENGNYNRMASLVLRDGLQYFECPYYSSFSVLHVIVSNVTTPVVIKDISADFTSQPVSYKGSFSCSDPYLNKVWKSCRWATQICLQTHHLDSPDHQEPIADYGDYLIEDLVNFYAFDQPQLAKQDLRKFAWVMKNSDYKTFHTSYILLWVQSLLQYYQYTGDTSLIRELSPEVYGVIDRFSGYIGENGIISEAPNYMFMDWVNIDGFNCHHPPCVIGQGYMTAFYCKALQDAAEVAIIMGDNSRAEIYESMRDSLIHAFNTELWVPDKGMYRDGKPFQTHVKPYEWMPADKDIETFSAQCNSLAVLYDIAPRTLQKSIMEKVLRETPWNVRPYFMHFVLDAMAHAGLFDRMGTTWLHKWRIIPQTQTFYEMGDQGDLSHGWIATPLCQLSERVLGIKPGKPGYEVVGIQPEPCDLSWAKGAVPTPRGLVKVNWKKTEKRFTMEVAIPRKLTGSVRIPPSFDGNYATLSVNGKVVWRNGKSELTPPGIKSLVFGDGKFTMEVAGGDYKFELTE